MPRDHYISQVHLRKFYAAELDQKMYATRKKDLHTFQCGAESQCRTMDGSTNAYLLEERAVENFLKPIENEYNNALNELRAGRPSKDCVRVVSGFVAYVMSYSPAAMRINTAPLRANLESSAILLERMGEIPPPPSSLGSGTISELLDAGAVRYDVDEKYAQAIGYDNLIDKLETFGNSNWNIVLNPHTSSPFFTSDYPIANEESKDPRILNRVVPLAPDVAIRIRPSFESQGKGPNFPLFRFTVVDPTRHQVSQINREIVRAAETVVYYSRSEPWIPAFIKKNRDYRVETWVQKMDYGDGIAMLLRQGTRPFREP